MKILLSLTDQSFRATKSVGIFNVSMGLARGLMHCEGVRELHLLGNEECAEAFAEGLPEHVHLHLTDKAVPRRFGRIWWDQFGLPAAIRRIAPDWAILPKGFPPMFPRLGRTKLACYVHDVIWEYYAELSKKGQNPFPWYENIYFRLLGKQALRKSDLVLTSTRFNAERFAAHEPAVRTAVVGIGFDTPAAEQQAPRGKDVLFYASGFPHKLTPMGVQRLQAWLAQRADAESIRIHTIGKMPEELRPSGDNWVQHGRLPQEELHRLMTQQCRASVYCSAYEGFGMPPVESLRAGLPCVASDIPPIRENIPPAYLFRNEDEADFIRTMNRAYDSTEHVQCPTYPTWAEVAQRVVRAMQEGK